MRRRLIAGNWKMNGGRAQALGWARAAVESAALTEHELAVFPPYPWLAEVAAVLGAPQGAVRLGAQACHPEPAGAFTGAVSASMLAEAGCTYCLCGHSERRQLFGETDAFVGQSLRAALSAGLVPILCVGETLAEREAGDTAAVVLRQLEAGLDALPSPSAPLVVAYEPVWAIGTGRSATPGQAAEVHRRIRERVAERDPTRARALRILYGGSVKPDNMDGFLGMEEVDGALVGGASLDPAAFRLLARAGRPVARRSAPPPHP